MMPGETHSAAPGTAADLAQCPGCASLQQNLNEYVEALITLKQKIINTDNLLTEYQKKCDELQFARRENSTLHHQVEQMLQKISPLQKCQEELGALKAELEEKKSSLKLYQASHQEYARVKEECLRSDAQKKKLEAKVKKLEEAALKQTQDFKQLKNEKKILEREFKKTQERLVEFSTQKNAKGLRHIGTQISSDSYGGIDKSSLFAALGIRNKQGSWSGHLSKGEYSLEALEKVKLLLKELWLCVNTAHRLPRDASRHTPEKSAQDDSSFTSREDGTESPSQGSPSRASTAQACLAELAMEVEESFAPRGSVHRERPLGAALSRDPAPHEDRGPAVVMQNPDESKTVSSDQAPCFDEDLQAAIDFFRFPLPLVSPVPSPPLTSSPNHQRPFPSLLAPETYFGEYTDSSDNEAPHEDSAGSATEDDMAEAQACFGLSRKSKGSGAWKGTPKSKEAVQARNRCTVNEVRTVVGETSAPLGVPSGFTEAERSPERSQSAPAERVLPGPSRSLVGEDLSDSRSAGNGATASKPGLYFRPLGKRPLNELMDSEEKASSSKKIGSPLSGFTKGSFADEIAFRSDCATGFASFPNTPRETAKEGEDELESTSESSDSEDDDPGDGFGPGGLDVGGTTSSSASAPGCSFSHPQPSKLEYINDADRPSRAMPTEQNRSPPQSEPPEPSVQRNSLHPLNPGWEALTLRSPRSRQTGVKTVEDRLRISVSQPLRRMTGDGQGGSRDTEAASPLPSPSPSPSPSSSGSQSGSSESDSDADKSTLWHYGDLVRRGGEGTPSVPLEHAHDSTHQLEKAGPALQDRGSSATLELAKEHTSPSSLLLSPVPVIPEQAGPEQGQNDSAGSGPREKKKLTSASENNDNETDHVSAAKDADSGPQEHKLTSASENCHNKADHVSAAKDADSEPQEHKLSLTSENCDNRADHVSAAKDADSGPQEHKLSLTSENCGSEMDHVSATKDADSGPQAHESTLPSENCGSEMDHVSAAEDGDSELQEHKLTSASENCDNRADHVSAAEDGNSEPQADESTSASENCDSEMDHVSAAKDGDSEPQEHELTLTSENCDSEMDHVSAAEDADSEPHAHESTSASENWDNEMDPVSTAKGVDSGPQAHELTLTSENCDSEMDHVSAAEDADSEPQAHESTSASENCDSEMDHISAAKDADSEPQELKSTSASENWDNETDPVSTAKGVDSGPQAHELTLTSENYSNEMDHLSTAKGAGEGGGATGNTEEEPAERSTFPELSLSCSTQDFGSQDISLPAENGDGCTGRKLSFSSEDNLCQSQDSSKEAAVLEEGPSGEAQQTSSGTENSEPPTEPAVSGGHPEEEVPCGRADRPDIDALAFANGSATQQSSSELSRLTSPAPRASPQPFLAAGTTLPSSPFRTDERAQEIPISSLPGTSSEAGKDTGAEESKPFSCSEGEQEAGTAVGSGSRGTLGERMAVAAEDRPSVDVGFLTLALQDFNISALPDRDGISASEVAVFLEGCQLKDCSSGDSVPECSSSGTLNKDVSQELVQSGISEETQERQLCAEETPDNIQEWIESEEETSSGNASQLVRSSLETMSEVLSKIGQELQTNCGHRAEEDTGSLSLLSETSSTATGAVRESSAPAGASSSAPHSPEQPPPLTEEECADGRSPARGLSQGGLAVDPAAACVDTGKDGLAGPVGSSALTSDSAAESRMEQSSGDESETFQSHMSALASEVPGTYPEKGHAVGVEKETGWTVSPDTAHSPEEEGEGDSVCMTSIEIAPDSSHAAPPSQEPLSDGAFPGAQGDVSCNGQSANFDKSRLRNRPVKPSIWISSQMYDQTFEAQNVASDHTYYNSKLEPLGKNKTPRSKISNKEQSNKPVKTSLSKEEFPHSHLPQPLSGESGPESQKGQTPPILVQADPSVSTDGALDALSKIRQEVGPPLPPLLAPLIATPPRAVPPLSPLPCSPSPACDTPGPPVLSPRPEDPPSSSPSEPSPSPFSAAGGRILSSPLQFCAATPKHALPVPGRLPPCAPGPAAVGGPQENSVKILDTMYPELSARARTLSILKGNMQLSGGTSADGRALPGRVSALLGLKAITSTTTAFVKTGSGSGVSGSQGRSRDVGTHQAPSGKRALPTPAPRSAKRLRLDGESPEPEPRGASGAVERPLPAEPTAEQGSSPVPQLPAGPKETVESHDQAVVHALKKVAESTFDLLPVIRSHVYVGNISKKPVMRDQEKEVVYEFSTTKKHLAECLLRSILAELKLQRKSVDHSYIHALCRVYVGICRQLGDLERARLFCYSLLKEDFPESEKLALFIANMWDDVFVSQSVISKAMQLVARQRAKGEVLNCLRAFLNWEKSAPVDVGIMVSKLLLTIQLCPKTEFQASEKYGEDLSGHTWEYIFAIDLLCCHQKWIWTHDNIISKELWPVMDKWIKYRKGHSNITFTPDVIIASVLRLIGRLGQLGLKEGFPTAVKNISSVIGTFIQHAQDEDIPWGVQLAAVYALCDLSPSNPAEIAQVLEDWRRRAPNSVPSAILAYLEEVGALSEAGGPRAPAL